MRHIGLFGGSFNPVHTGHLLAARAVQQALRLDKVIFLPAAQSPFKERPEIDDRHRVAMLKRALEDYPEFEIDRRELDTPPPSWTINTLRSFHRQHPGDHLYLLIGMDAWQTFEQWHQWRSILDLCHLVVMSRPGYTPGELSTYWQERTIKSVDEIRKARAGKFMFIAVPQSEAASSRIREQLARGDEPGRNALPGSVNDYIESRRLYQQPLPDRPENQ